MSLSVKELLRSRIKCMIRYPDSPFPVGAILEQDFEEQNIYRYCDQFNNRWTLEDPQLYPEVFKEIQWWQDRKPEELPLYVMNAADKKVYITTQYDIVTGKVATRNESVYWFDHSLHDLLPSTEAEYNAYINKQ